MPEIASPNSNTTRDGTFAAYAGQLFVTVYDYILPRIDGTIQPMHSAIRSLKV